MEKYKVDLSVPPTEGYDPGRPFPIRALWFLVNAFIIQNSYNPSSAIRRSVLRAFGAKIGKNVYIKPGVNIKFPWFLTVGENTLIGENAWIDNLAAVNIGANVCISQDVYICTGNHDWSDVHMGYRLSPIEIEDGAWICARAVVTPGVHVGENAIVSVGSVLTRNAEPSMIYVGNPAVATKPRRFKDVPSKNS